MSNRLRASALLGLLSVAAACGSTKHDFGPPDSEAGSDGAAVGGARSSAGDGSGPSGGNAATARHSGNSGVASGDAAGAGPDGSPMGGAGGEAGAPATPACGAPNTPCCDGDSCDSGATCKASSCACNAKLSACASNCVALKSDPKNCGACGHDCLGGDCDLGVCQPFNIVTGQSHVTRLALDSTNVYWSGSDASYAHYYVARRRIDGSDAVKFLSATESGANALAIAADHIYWMGGGHLRVCDLPDCSKGAADYIPTAISSACSSSISYVAGKNALFYGCAADYNNNNGSLWSLTLGSVSPVNLVPSPANPVSITGDEANLYWLTSSTYTADNQNKDGGATRLRLSDGAKTTLVTGLQGDIYAFAVGGTALYYAGSQYSNGADALAIYKVPLPNGLGGAAAPKFADSSSASSTVGSMVADDQYLYYSESDNSGAAAVKRCPHAGCPTPETIAPGTGGALIQDSVSLYWATGVNVSRLAK